MSHSDPAKGKNVKGNQRGEEESDAAENAAGSARAAEEKSDGSSEQIQKLLAEKQELLNTLVRRQADFENYRKRVEKERTQERQRALESLIEHLLPVLDAFDRALMESSDSAYLEYRKGFEMIRRQLWEALAKQGLVRIDAVDQEFNPHFHHAIERVETTEHADGIVIGELQPGYLFHGRVLRPAMVRVATEPETKSVRISKTD
ncbi:MAG TPA: nucleotide exchange factor GrpE [Candidatus Dormibacteraeota bacterium]|nr:nucleotide exchange factor GrpE [Candidatus Dormibacteraeota bacterium]